MLWQMRVRVACCLEFARYGNNAECEISAKKFDTRRATNKKAENYRSGGGTVVEVTMIHRPRSIENFGSSWHAVHENGETELQGDDQSVGSAVGKRLRQHRPDRDVSKEEEGQTVNVYFVQFIWEVCLLYRQRSFLFQHCDTFRSQATQIKDPV